MRTRLPYSSRAVLLSAVLVSAFAGPALAESACKGLDQKTCESKADCTWIKGYTRKDGKEVSGYCKSIGKSGGGAEKAAPAAGPSSKPMPKDTAK
jgi:hypothetical protein